jgi:hypothetical protein
MRTQSKRQEFLAGLRSREYQEKLVEKYGHRSPPQSLLGYHVQIADGRWLSTKELRDFEHVAIDAYDQGVEDTSI